MPATRDDVLNDPGFYQKPLDFQEKVLAAVDPNFSALNFDQRTQALVSLNSSAMDKNIKRSEMTGGSLLPEGQIQFDSNMTPAEVAGVQSLLKGGPLTPKAQPSAIEKFSLSSVPTNILTGLGNIPSLVTAPIAAYKTLRGTPPTEEQTAAQIKKIQKEGIGAYRKEGFTKALPQLQGYAEGAASGLTWGTLDKLLTPPVSKEQEAARVLGQYTTGALSGKAAYDAGKAIMRPWLARLTVPAVMGAAPGVAELDPGKAIQGTTTGLGAAGIAELAGRGAAPILEHYSPAERALRAESKALGGGQGILSELNKQIVESKTPGLSEAGYEVPASVVEGGQTVQNAGLLAGKQIRAVMSDRLNTEVRPLAPADAVVPDSHSEQFRILSTEGPEALRSTVQKKLGKLGAVEEEAGGTARAGWAGRAADILGKSRLTEAQRSSIVKQATELSGAVDETTAKELKNLFGSTEVGQKPATFSNLIDLYQALGDISTPNDKSARFVTLAKDAVKADLKTLGKTYPDAYRAWELWNKDYARDVGQFHGPNAPLRQFYNRTYGRPDMDASKIIENLAKGTPEQAANVMQGIRAGPAGPAAVDNISASAWQHLLEKHTTDIGTTDLKSWVRDLSQPAQRRVWEQLLGPRFDAAMNLRKALIDTGLHKYEGGPSAVGVWEKFHAVRGLFKLASGNITGAAYHLGTAGQMELNAGMVARLANNKMGAKLLAAGLLEKPGTPRATVIVDKLSKMAGDLGGEEGMPTGKQQPVSEADIVHPPGYSATRGLPQPTIYQGPPAQGQLPPSTTKQLPYQPQVGPPAPGPTIYQGPPAAPKALSYLPQGEPIPVLPELTSPARESAQVFKEAALAEKAFRQSPQGKEAQLRSYRAQQAAMKGKFAWADQAVIDIRDRFAKGNPGPNLEEHQALVNLYKNADKTVPPNLRDMAGAILDRHPVPDVPPLTELARGGLTELPPGERANLADIIKEAKPGQQQGTLPVKESTRERIKAVGEEVLGPASDPVQAIRDRQKAVGEAFQPKGKKSVNEAELGPVQLMNRITVDPITKTRSQFLVDSALMDELKSGYGDKASQWFTDKPGPNVQSLDDAIALFGENYGITPDYNAFRAHLDDAFNAYKPAKRMTTIRRKGDTRTAKEKAEAARIIAEKKK